MLLEPVARRVGQRVILSRVTVIQLFHLVGHLPEQQIETGQAGHRLTVHPRYGAQLLAVPGEGNDVQIIGVAIKVSAQLLIEMFGEGRIAWGRPRVGIAVNPGPAAGIPLVAAPKPTQVNEFSKSRRLR